tara:strand:+ start:369 stop:1016 length:648 start_codon:yes stop_codon:yes gene_type:complete
MDLVINGKEYYVPKKWNEINLKRYISFITTYSDEATDAEKELHLISTLLGVSTDIIGKAKKSVIDKVVEELKGLVEQPANENLVLEFEIDGIEYGFNPNLSELKLKEFVDLDNRLDNGWQDMHRVMAILYRPVVKRHKEKYEIEEYDFRTAAKRADIFLEELSVDIVNAAASFFLSIVMDYIKITALYSKADRKTKRGALRQMKKVLTRGTGGTE